MDFRNLLGHWMHFFVGLVVSTIAMITAADGVGGMIVGIIALSLVATLVAIPLLVVTALWTITSVLGFVRRRRYEATTGETWTNTNWREPTSAER
jgi:hypothetical protein